MQFKEALALKKVWGDKPCNHPNVEKEYYLGTATGDYVCTTCGLAGGERNWNKEEYSMKEKSQQLLEEEVDDSMNRIFEVEVDSVEVSLDWETGERAGAGGTFQLEKVILKTSFGEDLDITKTVDQGKHYNSLEEVAKDLGLPGVDIEDY